MRALSLMLLCAAACEGGAAVPALQVEASDGALSNANGVLLYRGQPGAAARPFTGDVVETFGGQLLARTSYRQGQEHGLAMGWYASGGVRHERRYRDGRKAGTHYGFWEDGRPQFVSRYERDLLHGEQEVFFRSGARAELRSYKQGHEEGVQRVFSPEGRITSNYTFRNGRRYGIVGRLDCVSVHER